MDSLDQINSELGKSDDPVLVALRGHLLLEERLFRIVSRACREPKHLDEARLGFAATLAVAQAIVGRPETPLWSFARRLNKVRNKFAHNLDPGDIDVLVGSVADQVRPSKDHGADQTPLGRLVASLLWACGYLDALGGSVHLGPAYADHRRDDEAPTHDPATE